MKRSIRILPVFLLLLGVTSSVFALETQQLTQGDTELIAEAYHLWKTLGEKIWPGWTDIQAPLLYITNDYEYAIGFPPTMPGFQSFDQNRLLGKAIQIRKRVLSPDLSASFLIEGIPAVVIGTPPALEKSPGEWILTAVHEMFHVLQFLRGERQKVAELKLGPESDASWQLNFPFLYQDEDIMRLIHLQSYLVYLAATAANEMDVSYNARTAVEAIRVYQSLLQSHDDDDRFYAYSQFQEWKEGIAYYTEYKMAEAAADISYQPTEAFRQHKDFKTYQQLWDENYKNRIFFAKHAGRVSRSRLTFYHLGLGKGLLLDRLVPDWKNRYFAPKVWLDDLLLAAVGQPKKQPNVAVGATAPDINLMSTAGDTVSLRESRGKVVLLVFWQTWCAPCLEEIPHLKALQEKYRAKGLLIWGIVDRLDREGVEKVRRVGHDYAINYVTLIDEEGTVSSQYDVSAYPHVFIIDREGRIVYNKTGYIRGEEAELDKQIEKVLDNRK